jgi:hypothetical protein
MSISKQSSLWLLGLALLGLLMVSSAFTSPSPTPPKGFVVGKAGQPLSKEIKAQLLKAYKAQFGRDTKINRIEVVPYQGKNWLAFQSGGEGSPTLAIQLKELKGKWGIDRSAVTNTCTGSPCSWCYFDSNNGCICNASGGGSCNHTQETGKDFDKIVEVLSM